jgi:hypothetical protein
MSWLSRALGLDKHPNELKQINNVGGAVVKGVEASSPIAGVLINAAEAIGGAPTNPITVVTGVGTVVSAFDPNFITQVEGATNNAVRVFAARFPQIPTPEVDAFIAELDAAEVGTLEALGFKAPA